MDNATYYLTPAEAQSSTWVKIEALLQSRLRGAQARLESPLTVDETNRVRGEIIELRAILKCAVPPPIVESHDVL